VLDLHKLSWRAAAKLTEETRIKSPKPHQISPISKEWASKQEMYQGGPRTWRWWGRRSTGCHPWPALAHSVCSSGLGFRFGDSRRGFCCAQGSEAAEKKKGKRRRRSSQEEKRRVECFARRRLWAGVMSFGPLYMGRSSDLYLGWAESTAQHEHFFVSPLAFSLSFPQTSPTAKNNLRRATVAAARALPTHRGNLLRQTSTSPESTSRFHKPNHRLGALCLFPSNHHLSFDMSRVEVERGFRGVLKQLLMSLG
jgi:hypothetical protein